jgi:hypothetical protein
MVPVLPEVAPCNGQDGKHCRLFSDHDRPRKTGPRFPLQVMCCRTHGIAFTLYPRGHVPYGRERIAPVAVDGSPCYGTEDTHRFAGTYFDAALQAAAGEAWPQDFQDDHPSTIPRFGTQLTRLARACLLTGVAPGLSEEHRAACAQVLAVPGQLLQETTQRIRDNPGYPSQGRAVCEVLAHLAMAPTLFERLASCGTAAGLWPPLHQWQPAVGLLQPTAFPWPGTRAPPPAIGAKERPQKP